MICSTCHESNRVAGGPSPRMSTWRQRRGKPGIHWRPAPPNAASASKRRGKTPPPPRPSIPKIGRGAWRGKGEILGGAVSFKKKKKKERRGGIVNLGVVFILKIKMIEKRKSVNVSGLKVRKKKNKSIEIGKFEGL